VLRDGTANELIARGRHDPCVVPRAVPMVEAMVALVLVDHLLQQHAQCNLFGGGFQGSDFASILPRLSETVDSSITATAAATQAYSED
jgi:hypothetical protein